MFRALCLVTSLLILLIFGHIYYTITGDFRPSNILTINSSTPFIQNTYDETEKAKKILQQPFSFLGYGHQTYVFVSQDQKYVLKFFMKDYLQRTWYYNIFPPIPPFKQYIIHTGDSKEYRMHRLLNGYATAYHSNRENSGLLYLHYILEPPLNCVVNLVNKLGLKEALNVSNFIFAIQERVATTREELTRLLREKNLLRAQERIQQIFDLYLSEYQLALLDHDHNLIDNTGFLGEKAIRHDLGKLVKDDNILYSKAYSEDLKKIAWERIDPWIASHFPEYREEIAKELKNIIRKSLEKMNLDEIKPLAKRSII
jgi:hypothetical protein